MNFFPNDLGNLKILANFAELFFQECWTYSSRTIASVFFQILSYSLKNISLNVIASFLVIKTFVICKANFFFFFFSMSMKVPEIVSQAKDALQSGCSVVIGLQTTGEVLLCQYCLKTVTQLKSSCSIFMLFFFKDNYNGGESLNLFEKHSKFTPGYSFSN